MTPSHTLSNESPLAIPQFRALWFGLIFMSSGVQFYAVALTWLVLELTGSSLQLGTILAISAIPRALMMLLSGSLIDRGDPIRFLLGASLGNGIIVAGVALLLGFDALTMLVLTLAGVIMGLLDAFFYPTSYALLPRLVHPFRLARANALMQGADGLINMIAPALSGLIIGWLGIPAALGLNAVLYLIGAIIVRGIGKISPVETDQRRETAWQSVRDGVRYAMKQPAIRLGLMAIAALNFAAIGPVVVGGAVLVQQRFNGDAEMYGIFLAAYGVGALIGSLIAGTIDAVERPGRMLIWTAIALGVALIAIGFSQTFWAAFGLMAVSSVIVGGTMPFFSAWIQAETPMTMQGRIASLLTFSAVAVDPFSQGIAGALSQVDVTLAFSAAGVLLLIVGIGVFFSPTAHLKIELKT
ncbi:MAG: MFS transporter [Anaerolineae bacterium]|jgi:MFS family permease|nr:MFS transporter [Anaerolineae bacterium]